MSLSLISAIWSNKLWMATPSTYCKRQVQLHLVGLCTERLQWRKFWHHLLFSQNGVGCESRLFVFRLKPLLTSKNRLAKTCRLSQDFNVKFFIGGVETETIAFWLHKKIRIWTDFFNTYWLYTIIMVINKLWSALSTALICGYVSTIT